MILEQIKDNLGLIASIITSSGVIGGALLWVGKKILNKTLENTGNYRLVICNNAVALSDLPVTIQVNGVNIPVLCKAGNTIYSSQLKKRVNYGIMYGNENTNYINGQFVIQNCIRPKAVTIGGEIKSI